MLFLLSRVTFSIVLFSSLRVIFTRTIDLLLFSCEYKREFVCFPYKDRYHNTIIDNIDRAVY